MTTVSVTAEHIAKGLRRDCGLCPVALAIRDTFPGAAWIAVTGMYARMELAEHELPAEAQQFTWDFDNDEPIEPFTFELDYPAVTR